VPPSIVDPCATASGVAAAPAEDLRALRALCDEHGILLIVDEVITGFCRTGEMFASGLYDVRPDLMPLSKALSSGYMPIGATLVADTVVDTIAAADAEDAVFAHGHTYGAHPVACAVALENIRILQEEQLAERAARMGAYLRDGLLTLAGHDSYVDARGVGMLNGLEVLGSDEAAGVVRVGERRVPLAAPAAAGPRARDADRAPRVGVPARPPLVITEDEVDRLVAILDQGLTDLEARR
jgi:adenosylmethionine-8-amino-7-oxononanoate aminotransferase